MFNKYLLFQEVFIYINQHKLVSHTTSPRFIDVFAGAGGISLGLLNAGWKGLFAIEKSNMAFDTLKHNLINKKKLFEWPDWLPISEHDIDVVIEKYKNDLISLRNKVDLVSGGPPCQGFSLAGRRKYNDERNLLVRSYIEFIKLVLPKIVFLENVSGFTSGLKQNEKRDRAYSEYVKEKLNILGYHVAHQIIDFSKFGVPQKRKRFILVGIIKGNPQVFFQSIVQRREEFLTSKGLKQFIPVGEAISDLEKVHGIVSSSNVRFKEGIYGPIQSTYQKFMQKGRVSQYPDSHRFANHRESTINRSKYILENCPRNTDIGEDIKFKFNLRKHTIIPMDKNSQSLTLTTLPDDFIHYSEPRILTVREYARIQTFPDWYEIRNKYTTGGERRRFEIPRYTQMGNAVPPLFAELAGVVLKDLI